MKLEYTIDDFLAEGKGISIPLTQDSFSLDSLFDINVAGLEPGVHSIHIRSQNALGIWSLPVEKTFYVVEPDTLKVRDIYYRYLGDDYKGEWRSAKVNPYRSEVDSVLNTSVEDLTIGENYNIEFYAVNTAGVKSFPAVSASFLLRANHAPEALRLTSVNLNMDVDELLSFDLDTLFSDDDLIFGDSLSYTIVNTSGSGLDEFVSLGDSAIIKFSPKAGNEGEYNFWIKATDLSQETDSIQYFLNVKGDGRGNQSPVKDKELEKLQLTENFNSMSIDLEDYFSDPDNDDITFEAFSSNEDVVTVEIKGGLLNLKEVGNGKATITITASDGEASVKSSFEVIVADPNSIEDDLLKQSLKVFPNPGDGLFNLELNHQYQGKVLVSITGLDGKEHFHQTWTKNSQTLAKDIALKEIPSGLYLLKIRTDKASAILRLVVNP